MSYQQQIVGGYFFRRALYVDQLHAACRFNPTPETHSTWCITAKLSRVQLYMYLHSVPQKTALIFTLHITRITRQRIVLYHNAWQRVVCTNQGRICVNRLNILSWPSCRQKLLTYSNSFTSFETQKVNISHLCKAHT